MDIDEIRRQLSQALTEEFEIEEEKISPSASIIDDIGLDSLDMVDLAVVIDRIFSVRLTREELAGARTFGQLADLIAAKRP